MSLLVFSLVPLMGISVVTAQEPTPVPNPNAGDSNPSLVASLRQSGARISYHSETGQASFIGAAPGQSLSQVGVMAQGASKEAAARGFLAAYGLLFGINNQSSELVRENEKIADATRTFERFQQVYNTIPVLGAELIVQVNNSNGILSANGKVLPKIAVSTTASVSAADAAKTALDAIAKIYNLQTSDLTVTVPALWIYNPILIGPGLNSTHLVWRMDVSAKTLAPIRELVLVDAQLNGILLRFNQIDNALSRKTYTANNGSTLPGSLVCTESNPTCSNGDLAEKGAHNNAGATYNFYANVLGRDSINNAGMTLISTVHYRDPDYPNDDYQNAFWDGNQMVYGDYSTYSQADDVVGHELTHGVTQYESGLFYYYQSGAINESLSDVFGELVDQSDGIGSDTPADKWKLGEDLNSAYPDGVGEIRNMADPTLFGDPDKMTSTNYYSGNSDAGVFGDNGGVHTNSGVNNKAAYLMTDGGTFNGYTVSPLGITKVAKIYYEAQRHLLTTSSDYADLYNILYQACVNLIGNSGISSGDCQEVRDATDAVEMNLQPHAGYNTQAPLCPTGQNVDTSLFSDDLESGTGKWSFGANPGTNHWTLDSSFWGTYANSGSHSLYAFDYPYEIANSYAAMKTGFTVPANGYLHFAHAYGFFEYPVGLNKNYDGGVLDYSTNNGVSWSVVPNGWFDVNGYSGTVQSPYNPLYNQYAFVGDSHGYISSRLNLSALAGLNVRFRWRVGLGNYLGYIDHGWWVDDVNVYSCATPPANDNFATPTTITISGSPYANQTNAGASLENLEQAGSCETAANIKKSVWYQYTATGAEKVTFKASGSAVVKGISVWTGSSLGNLTQVGCGTGATASAPVITTTGTDYYIRVGSSNGVSTSFTLEASSAGESPLRNYFTIPNPTLSWSRVTTATGYKVQISSTSTFTPLVYPAVDVPAGTLSLTLDGPLALTEGVYYWRVSANNGTTWSAVDSFIIDLP